MNPPSLKVAIWASAVILAVAALPKIRESREPPPAPARSLVVEIRSFRFEPAQLTAAPGDTIVWVNHDIAPHTVTGADGAWDSGDLAPGAGWSTVVPAEGLGGYLCSYHPMMTGAVDAQLAGSVQEERSRVSTAR